MAPRSAVPAEHPAQRRQLHGKPDPQLIHAPAASDIPQHLGVGCHWRAFQFAVVLLLRFSAGGRRRASLGWSRLNFSCVAFFAGLTQLFHGGRPLAFGWAKLFAREGPVKSTVAFTVICWRDLFGTVPGVVCPWRDLRFWRPCCMARGSYGVAPLEMGAAWIAAALAEPSGMFPIWKPFARLFWL